MTYLRRAGTNQPPLMILKPPQSCCAASNIHIPGWFILSLSLLLLLLQFNPQEPNLPRRLFTAEVNHVRLFGDPWPEYSGLACFPSALRPRTQRLPFLSTCLRRTFVDIWKVPSAEVYIAHCVYSLRSMLPQLSLDFFNLIHVRYMIAI